MIKKDQVLLTIRDRIYSGFYWPREKLVETALADEMKVSRTIVREVLRELATKDLIYIQPNKGAFVAEISYEKIREFLELEAMLEGSAAYLATLELGDAEVRELNDILDRSEKMMDPKPWSLANRQFHTLINAGCGNSKLIGIIRDNVSFLRFWFVQLSTADEITNRNNAHREILRAIENRNPSSARELMEKHIIDSLGDLLKRIQNSNPVICKSRNG